MLSWARGRVISTLTLFGFFFFASFPRPGLLTTSDQEVQLSSRNPQKFPHVFFFPMRIMFVA